ncbi:MAG: hypothetical protein QF773_06465 [Lentisphaeria bacterium]|nr:hypothetical protein [Lentisphaeria bacterium]
MTIDTVARFTSMSTEVVSIAAGQRLDADVVGAECLGVLTKAGIVQPSLDAHPRSPPGLIGSSPRNSITKQ